MVDTQVLIVGAGPVGLTLAVDLGLRGVRCTAGAHWMQAPMRRGSASGRQTAVGQARQLGRRRPESFLPRHR